MVSTSAKGYVKAFLKLIRNMSLHVEQVWGAQSTQECFFLPLIMGRNLGIKDQELIIPLKAGCTACLSLVLYYFPASQDELAGRGR